MELTLWTLTVAVLEIAPTVTVTVAVPAATPVTPPPWLTVAMEPLLGVTLHAHSKLMDAVVPSLKVPIACNPNVVPIATPAVDGLSTIDTSEAPLTVSGADPVTPSKVACITVEPADTPEATFPPITDATPVFVLLQVASARRSCVVPSLNSPSAGKSNRARGAMVWFTGETTIAVTVALVTTSGTLFVTPVATSVAVIVAVPGVRPLALPELLIVATVGFAEVA